ncbi:Aste57867_13282 [Aphanomyces stellatus]|uniref:Aste57867_13282 protein n=1 Tax=Aphanomyces stellatus TaxID=120398 RepID=A0A485KZF1_9STRA|nr:hypothetical protein As57867_013233 [Aphanomyces stellatus]VFT90121.1 Aste57867_13282 [Aphanomyces stellatus]
MLAVTDARQRRCDVTNSAVCVDTLFRNTDMDRLNICWGDAIDTVIFQELRQSNDACIHPTTLSIHNEVVLWAATGLMHYTTTWQNYKTLGIVETVAVRTAFGASYPLTLKSSLSSMHLLRQMSAKASWPLGFLLSVVATGNATSFALGSFIRSSATFAFHNRSIETWFTENATLASPLDAVPSISSTYHVQPPSSLTFYQTFSRNDTQRLLQTPAAQISVPGAASLIFPVPTRWLQEYKFMLGGNILYPSHAAKLETIFGLLTFVNQEAARYSVLHETFSTTRMTSVLALVATGVTSSCALFSAPCLTIADVCSNTILFVDACVATLQPIRVWVDTFLSAADQLVLHSQAIAIQNNIVLPMAIQIAQFAQRNVSTAPVEWLHLGPLDPADPHFRLFAWYLFCDWVVGTREVLTL